MLKKVALILPVLSGMLWGSVGIFVRRLQEANFDSVTIVSSRTIFAAILLGIGLLLFKREFFKIKLKDLGLFIGCGVFGMMLMNFGYNAAVDRLTLSFAAVLLSLAPIFVMIFAAILFKEKITTKKILCMFLAIIGCTLVSGLLESAGKVELNFMGIFLGVMAAVFYALYSTLSKIVMQKGYNVFTVIFYGMVSVSIIMLPFTDWNAIGSFAKAAPVENISFLLIYAIGTAILPYVLYTLAMSYADAGKVAILGSGGEPAAAMLFGWAFFAEAPSLLSILGLVVTVVALTFICMPDKKAAVAEELEKAEHSA